MSDQDTNHNDTEHTIPTDLSRSGSGLDQTHPTNLNSGMQDPDTLATIANVQGGGDTVLIDRDEPGPSVSIGTPQIPGYEILRILGEGGMGVVYEARQVALNRVVALKVLKPAVAQEPEFRNRFLRESAAAGQVAHPNVVQIFDAGEANGHLYMTFQKVDGGDLSDLLKEKGSLSEFKALSIIKECLIGLQAIHAAGLVHRDIKPGNIFMENGRRPVIGDLGLARQTSGDDRMTMTGAAMGTPSYMSPEHIRGVPDIDIRTDIYAFGSTLYKMITGVEPFQGDTVYAITHSIISQPIPDPRELNASLSNPIVGIIRKAMAKEREERYQTPEQFLQDVEAALGGHQLIHAQGLGVITGVERPAEPLEEAASQKPMVPSVSKVHGSFLRTYAKPIMFIALITWFVFLIDELKLDTSRFEPDWAEKADRDRHGRFVDVKVGTQTMTLRLIRGGEKHGDVVVGAQASEPGYRDDEALMPAKVEKDFWMADSEVTQALWLEIMDDNPSDYENSYAPVHNVSYKQVQEFIEHLNKLFSSFESPFKARLPTELEWEMACRAGLKFKKFGDQDVPDDIAHVASGILRAEWERLNQETDKDALLIEEDVWQFVLDNQEIKAGPQLVKQLQPNRWGLYDMIGNVAEWCSDDWDGISGHAATGKGNYHALRGGSWFHHPNRSRAACREAMLPENSTAFSGFRIVVELASKSDD